MSAIKKSAAEKSNSTSNSGGKIKATRLIKLLSYFSNSWTVLYLASCKSRMHYSITLKIVSGTTLIKMVSAFFLIVSTSLESKHLLKLDWTIAFGSRYLLISQKPRRSRGKWDIFFFFFFFEDSFSMNIHNLKINRKINSIRIWSSRKVEFFHKIRHSSR